ncbi:MAG: hypothetical protein JW940_37140 [Polyangiaceae bacterium]|nr:hypothetical protein [Polyangiaceae bacterium]
MGTSSKTISVLRVFGAVLCATLGNSNSALSLPAAEAATAPAAITAPAPRAVEVQPVRAAQPAAEQEQPRKLRRLKPGELTVAIAKQARRIINANHMKPFGTEIPFEIEATDYVGRIEQHYHPPGGKLHPWGYHPGCSVFVVER